MQDNVYAQRLISEWDEYGNIIIAFDYDDTIKPWKLRSQEECDRVIDIIKEAKEIGAFLVCFTACKADKHDEIFKYCEQKQLLLNSINRNPIHLPFGNDNKVYANIFLDDRGGLEEALKILKYAIDYKRNQLTNK